MQYIQLNSNSYVLHLSDGFRTLTAKSFNYKKIQRLIQDGAEEDEILPLLQIPPLPDGVYEAYALPSGSMIYLHIGLTGERRLVDLQTELPVNPTSELEAKLGSYFVGIYASLADLLEDWPEYLF